MTFSKKEIYYLLLAYAAVAANVFQFIHLRVSVSDKVRVS